MQLTNRLGLPDSIVRAVASDPYKSGGDISVTRLISAPYQRKLMHGSGHVLVEDVADRIWSLMGQIGHSLVERVEIDADVAVAEKRLFMPVQLGEREVIVSGQFDLIERGVLTDFKFTSVYSSSGKIEWTQQLNLLRALCAHHFKETGDQRYLITSMQIIAVYRDWQKAKVGMADYPKSQVGVIHIPMWTLEEAQQFMFERVSAHMAADPAPCTDEERWATEEVWALMKKGRKTAVKLYRDEGLANAAAALKGKDHVVVHRPRTFKRCESYCAAAGVCPVWKEHAAAAPF